MLASWRGSAASSAAAGGTIDLVSAKPYTSIDVGGVAKGAGGGVGETPQHMWSGTSQLVSSPRRGEVRGSGMRGRASLYTEGLPPHPTLRAIFSPSGRRNSRHGLRSRMRLAVALFVPYRLVMIPGAKIHMRLSCLAFEIIQTIRTELGHASPPANRELVDRCRLTMKASRHFGHLTLFASKHLVMKSNP